jgi:hypothetical protein
MNIDECTVRLTEKGAVEFFQWIRHEQLLVLLYVMYCYFILWQSDLGYLALVTDKEFGDLVIYQINISIFALLEIIFLLQCQFSP